jgi:hypothetical protein
VDILESRALSGDRQVQAALFRARALGVQEEKRDSLGGTLGAVGSTFASFFAPKDRAGIASEVRTEQRGNATVITIATPSAASNLVASMLGAMIVVAGILLGIMLPGIIRREAAK